MSKRRYTPARPSGGTEISPSLCPKTGPDSGQRYVFASPEVDAHSGIPGTVVTSWVRCGKPSCRCATGEPHGPYFYHRWREDVYDVSAGAAGPTRWHHRRRYVPRHDAERVATLCARYRARHPSLREVTRMLRMIDGVLVGLLGQPGEEGR